MENKTTKNDQNKYELLTKRNRQKIVNKQTNNIKIISKPNNNKHKSPDLHEVAICDIFQFSKYFNFISKILQFLKLFNILKHLNFKKL